jgi:cytochrome P450
MADTAMSSGTGALKSIDEAPFLDFFTPEFQADPATAIAALRRQSWLLRTPLGVMVISRDKVQALLADPRLRSSLLDFVRLQGLHDGPIYDSLARTLLAIDGADHTRIRKLVSRAFTPRSVEQLRPGMRALVDELIGRFAPRGCCEFMSEFADQYPVQIVCELLGVPREHHGDFARWSIALTWVLSLELNAHRDEIAEAFTGLSSYVETLIEERRRKPEDDLLTRLIQAEEDGDHLSLPELQSLIMSLLFAGFDTTRNQLGIAMTLFAANPEQWALLARRPELAPQAVEEVVRVQGVVNIAPRFTDQEIVVGEYVIPGGTLMSLSTAAANHDPAAFRNPERFDITVEREPPLTFGGGAHYCLGANLARAEMQEALAILARRLRDLRIDGEVPWRPITGINGPISLPLAFTADT